MIIERLKRGLAWLLLTLLVLGAVAGCGIQAPAASQSQTVAAAPSQEPAPSQSQTVTAGSGQESHAQEPESGSAEAAEENKGQEPDSGQDARYGGFDLIEAPPQDVGGERKDEGQR